MYMCFGEQIKKDNETVCMQVCTQNDAYYNMRVTTGCGRDGLFSFCPREKVVHKIIVQICISHSNNIYEKGTNYSENVAS